MPTSMDTAGSIGSPNDLVALAEQPSDPVIERSALPLRILFVPPSRVNSTRAKYLRAVRVQPGRVEPVALGGKLLLVRVPARPRVLIRERGRDLVLT